MNIIFYHPTFDAKLWIDGITKRLPQANVRAWNAADHQPADYALVWRPPHAMLASRKELKGIFALGAGVDAILTQEQRQPGTLPAGVPLIRLEDTGMALQMQEYALASVLRYFRRMDEYQLFQQQKQWRPLTPHSRSDFTIGILGAGVLGSRVAEALVGARRQSEDNVSRYGGEEFLVILPRTDSAGALAMAERMRQSINALRIPLAASPTGYLTISIGIATLSECSMVTEDRPLHIIASGVINQADTALYAAKRRGRNGVVAAAAMQRA